MPKQDFKQITFGKGINPAAAPHLIADDEVQTATNVDFSLMDGAIVPRRGAYYSSRNGTSGITAIYRNYNNPSSIINGPFYIVNSAGDIYQGTNGVTLSSIANIGAASLPGGVVGVGVNKQYTLFANSTNFVKHDGTNVTQWIKQVPAQPTVTVSTLTPLTLAGTWSTIDGQDISSGTSTATFATDDSNTAASVFDFTTNSNLNVNGTYTIGDYGVHFINVAFSDPDQVIKIAIDYSIADSSFTNFWHYELNPQFGGAKISKDNAQSLINSQINEGTSSDAITSKDRLNIWSQIAQYNFQPLSFTPSVSNALTPWAVTSPQFQLVGNVTSTSTADLWTNIKALRINIVTLGTCTATVANPQLYGAESFPLTDVNSGYTYWQTYATLNSSGVKIGESAPSQASVGPIPMQAAQAKIISSGTATGSIHGITHIITYRQGGYMQQPYAIGTLSYSGTASQTTTDTMNDIDALSNNELMPIGARTPSQMPGAICSIESGIGDRVFWASGNTIGWSLPGQIDTFPLASEQEVSRIGDNVAKIINWAPGMVIINYSSIYELTGTDLEAGQYNLKRTGARKGSLAPKVAIRTPYGIPLLNMDSLTMYVPGYNNEQEIPWFMTRYGDMFKWGPTATDPVTLKGNRIPILNAGSIEKSVAAFKEGKLYLGVPTGTVTSGQEPNTLFVLDFIRQQAWWYNYPFSFSSLYVDERNGAIWCGATDGGLFILEQQTVDNNSSGSIVPIAYSARTKEWTTANDTILNDISFDIRGTNITLKAYYDNSTNPQIGTATNSTRDWITPPLNGTFANSVMFDIIGTASTTASMDAVYGLSYYTLQEPTRVKYWREDYWDNNWPADKLWDVAYFDLDQCDALSTATQTVTAVTFVDSTAVMTNTLTATQSGRTVQMFAFPPEIYGRVAYTTYTSGSNSTYFKIWETKYAARNEPAKINYAKTDIKSLDEVIIDAFDTDINPNGTAYGTVFVNNTAVSTATITGTNRLSYTFDIPTLTYPIETFGRTLYVTYSGTGFKHYNTWWHERPEPDRWNQFVSPKVTGDEREIKVFKPEVNCLGQTVLATTFLDGTAVSTHTITGTIRKQYTFSLPVEKYARTVNAAYKVSGTGTDRFKHYSTDFEGPVEPPRVTLFRTGPYPFESDHWFKTWQPQLDPLGGTVTGTLIVDDTIMSTQTFTGTRKQWFTVGIDLDTANQYVLHTGSRWEAIYSCATGQFKHYQTKLESDVDPFRKVSWSFHYKKIGGATQLDLARYWSLFGEVGQEFAVATYWWDIDGENFSNGTLTMTEGHRWYDRIAMPPGARGRLFEFRMYAPQTISVHNVNLDLGEVGVKNLVRRGHQGTPQDE